MRTAEQTRWELIESNLFLRNYLKQIERIENENQMVEEMIEFYREVDLMMGEVVGAFESVRCEGAPVCVAFAGAKLERRG